MDDVAISDTFTVNSSNEKNEVGVISELQFLLSAARRGFSVWVPVGHAHKADAILWSPPKRPISVQVKTASFRRDKRDYQIYYSSCGKSYQVDDVDVIVNYIKERDSYFFTSSKDIAGRQQSSWSPHLHPENNWDVIEAEMNKQ